MEKRPVSGPILKPERAAKGAASVTGESRRSHPPQINGLPLPDDLLLLISEGRWNAPKNHAQLDLWFPDRQSLTLYSLGQMDRENQHWKSVTEYDGVGLADDIDRPGNIDPTKSLLIGDIGLGYDQPIALDYRESMESPRVLFLRQTGDSREVRWIELAPDIGTFAEALGL